MYVPPRIKNIHKLISAVFLIMTTSLAFNSAHADEIDDFINMQMHDRKIPGLQLAIVKNNEIIKVANYGIANVQDAIPVHDDTVFTINSMTKAFTGVAIMQLVEQGKIKLDVGISAYLNDIPKAWHDVTITQLMSHTSGLPAILGNWANLIGSPDFDTAWEIVKKKPMVFETNSAFKYNQTNYVLLGKIIDKYSAMPFVEFIKKNQLNKAGMTKTAAAGFAHYERVIPHQARAYTYMQTGTLTNLTAKFSPPLRTAAGMTSSAQELAQWVIALQTGKLFDKDASLKTLWQPNILANGRTAGFNRLVNGYALGWPIIVRDSHPAVASIGGDRSALVIYPQDDLAIIVLTNLTGSLPSTFIDEIAGFYMPDMKAENGFGLSALVKPLWEELEKSGYDNILDVANSMQQSGDITFNEQEFNVWGYQLIAQKQLDKAVQVFTLNTQLFPKSANTYDSLAEAYWAKGNTAKAIEFYNKVLVLKPDNNYAKIQIKKIKAQNK